MGKDLKGKELGSGICQRKDGKYSARFTSVTKKRVEQRFDTITEARKWLAEAKYEDEHCNIGASSQMTVNAWYDYWITNVKEKTTRYNTARNYRERYKHNIRDVIGDMIISEVKPMHCQQVLNLMQEKYKGSTINQCRITMVAMFRNAQENQIIPFNPVISSVKSPKPVATKKRVLTLKEQSKFLEVAKGTSNYYQYLFVLNTGLRVGELMGLRWCDVDFKNRTISINQTLEFRYGDKEFKVGEPKSKSGYRTIPLTNTAYKILQIKKEEQRKRKICSLQFNDYVFLNRNGTPTKNSAYDSALYKLAEKVEIEKLSMHTLRHTFATRAIENGMSPKTLQIILGHSSLAITMDVYVHITDDEKAKEMKKIEVAFGAF